MQIDAFIDQVRGIVPSARELALRRLRDLLRVAIIDGDRIVMPNGRISPENDLTSEFGGTRDTMRDALSQLSDEGLIERRRGLGTRRSSDSVQWGLTFPAIGDKLEDHLAAGRITPTLLHWGWIKAPSIIASKLDGVEPGDSCLCIDYVLMRDEIPTAVVTNYLRDPEASRLRAGAFNSDFYTLLDSSGALMASQDDVLQASNATPDVAALLHIPVGQAVMSVEQTIRNINSERIDFAVGHFRRDTRIEFFGSQRSEIAPRHEPESI